MNEQPQDIYKCSVCLKEVKVTNNSNGTLICCKREMQNITFDRLGTFKLQSLKQKSALVQFLNILSQQMPKNQQDNKAAVDDLIQKNSKVALLLAKEIAVENQGFDLNKLLMNIIDDLWVSILIDYPQYIAQASFESKLEIKKLLTDAFELDRRALNTLEAILYRNESTLEFDAS
ncbi:hypothetical protein VIN01S_30740 [Vibrio inusitatus NBRC 102082]|uniref:Desulfoferrodoxin N-terminal domain-containing protein n=1 Tax=Vibrio inusitatus NBRC 102082 TaxID=1219070 RepID=A0A4Y3HZX5_9VIBR|nr:hypothetical protein [Vibrio inusitatus]GEA52270.1 hypothetical protein VIN01S_30740 [Vibrio inusitatus NBRC 102082]